MRTIFNLLIVIGVIVILGTAGASDTSCMSFKQILFQLFVSVILVTLGSLGLCFIKAKQKKFSKHRKISKNKFLDAA